MIYGDYHSYEELAKERMEKRSSTVKAKANLFRTLVVLAVVLVAVAVALFGVGLRTAETQTTSSYYKVEALGTVPGDTFNKPYSTPYGINDFGHVVGESSFSGSTEGLNGTAHAFLYKDGVMKDLGTLGGPSSAAHAINNSGQVVGWSDPDPNDWYAPRRAFLYDSTNGMQDLGTLGGPSSGAYDINNSGQVVGYSDTASGQHHAFVYENGVMQDLNTLMGLNSAANSTAANINDLGHVVGSYDTASGERHAFLYKDGVMQDLGTLGGSHSGASGINDSGQVVGWSHDSSGQQHAFLYKDGVMQDLGTLGGSYSYASDINDFDQVVGYSDNVLNTTCSTTDNTAFLYQNGEMIDLGTRLHPDSNGNVWSLGSANGINNEGQIVTDGWRKEADGSYTYSALLLTPTSDIPPPADCEAPSPPTITSPQDNSYDSDGSFSVSGSAEAGSTVELFEGTTSRGTTKADSSSGAWSIALSGVSEGAHTYYATATDAAGNTSSAANSVTVTVDKTAPKVDTVSPAENDTGVASETTIHATFSEAMKADSININTFKLFRAGTTTPIAAVVSYNTQTKTATLNPDANLRRGTKYKAVVSTGTRDLAGNQLDQDPTLSGNQPKEWTFTIRK